MHVPVTLISRRDEEEMRRLVSEEANCSNEFLQGQAENDHRIDS